MNRRGLLLGLGAALCAPAIVKAESLMKIAMLRETIVPMELAVNAGRIFTISNHGERWVTVSWANWQANLAPNETVNFGPGGIAANPAEGG